jgi:hypothetical protein
MLRLLDALADAIAARDLAHVWAIVNGPGSTALPQRVREEALSLAGLPPDSLRAPIALWEFRRGSAARRCSRFALLDWSVGTELRSATLQLVDEPGIDPSQLELPLATAGATA